MQAVAGLLPMPSEAVMMRVVYRCVCAIDELWKSIPEQPDYWISSKGRIRYVGDPHPVTQHRPHPPRAEYPRQNRLTGGYLTWHHKSNGVLIVRLVHRLVAAAFIANPDSKPEVNHLDGCKTHNCVMNLRWVTTSENLRHAYKYGLRTSLVGEAVPWSKLTVDQVLQIRTSTASQRSLAAQYRVSQPTISRIKTREIWAHVDAF